MYKLPLLLLIAALSWQCQSENNVREEARAQATAMATQATEAPPSSPANKSSVVPPEELAPGQTPPTINATLNLSLNSVQVKKGESSCLTVSAAGFTDLIGLQFSIRWEPEELSFERIDNMQLPHLSASNFGTTHTDKGVAVMSWINPNLEATSLAHQAPLFDICFQASGAVGTTAEVNFASRPTAFEVINVEEDILQFKGTNGKILIE